MKLGFFFGAGAEREYGLPSGGEFAIDIFRQDTRQEKEKLRSELADKVDQLSDYATGWLPQNYRGKRIHAFGRNEFTNIIESSIEYRKEQIIRRLNTFDQLADSAISTLGITRERLDTAFHAATEKQLGEVRYSQAVIVNPRISDDVSLFDSEYYSAILEIIKEDDDASDLRRYASAILQLLIGAYGQSVIQNLNQEIFTTAPDEIPIFDDVTGLFKVEFSRIGLTALELLIAERRSFDTSEDANATSLFCALSHQILENLFSEVLDYQSLIDSHFRYLFSPRTEWAKFCKMVIFLRVVREYISGAIGEVEWNEETDGYYTDLGKCSDLGLEIGAIGTANYNNIVESISTAKGFEIPEVHHLNGSIHDYYNPYQNSIITTQNFDEIETDQIHVPFILTQSGLKPLTSVEMSRRYVTLYDSYKEADAIVVVGFGFNIDDGHINGLFRELIEKEQKPFYWIVPDRGEEEDIRRELARKLRVSASARPRLNIVKVDSMRNVGDQGWLEEIKARIERS